MPKPVPLSKIDPQRLDALMKRAGYASDVELGKAVGAMQVGRWRQGKHPPGGDRLELMCRLLRCSPAFLFGRSEEEIEDYIIDVVSAEIDPGAGEVVKRYVDLKRSERARDSAPVEPWQEAPAPPPPSAVKPLRRTSGKRADAAPKRR